MERYRKVKVIGKGSFGHAVLVSEQANKKNLLVMKVDQNSIQNFLKKKIRLLIFPKWMINRDTTLSTRSRCSNR